jgi:hypothetical protein
LGLRGEEFRRGWRDFQAWLPVAARIVHQTPRTPGDLVINSRRRRLSLGAAATSVPCAVVNNFAAAVARDARSASGELVNEVNCQRASSPPMNGRLEFRLPPGGRG